MRYSYRGARTPRSGAVLEMDLHLPLYPGTNALLSGLDHDEWTPTRRLGSYALILCGDTAHGG